MASNGDLYYTIIKRIIIPGLRRFYINQDQCLTAPDALDPIVVTKNPQRQGDRFVETAGAHFDGVFNPAKINA